MSCDDVVTCFAVQIVVAVIGVIEPLVVSCEQVVTRTSEERVVRTPSEELIVARFAVDVIGAVIVRTTEGLRSVAMNGVGVFAAEQGVRAFFPDQRVGARVS